ncbi:DUF3973 domain-containing protein [Paenibacillus tyrfis]|uniref:DUF3973 domain-containing protein n=1 Tax=Paenibacillus tyrfis TaxID=1501230 RepID=UPI0009DFCEE3|nr:DUF3973 domain-containing protein [Paenibacillus tyrfis]
MYYCTVCSKLHDERYRHGIIFEKGFYIEPGTGGRFHLGMCGGKDDKGVHIQRTLENDCSIMVSQ